MINDTERTTNSVSTMIAKIMKERQPNSTSDIKGI
jgi:hypothetical protein